MRWFWLASDAGDGKILVSAMAVVASENAKNPIRSVFSQHARRKFAYRAMAWRRIESGVPLIVVSNMRLICDKSTSMITEEGWAAQIETVGSQVEDKQNAHR